jgi:hypothetical protein
MTGDTFRTSNSSLVVIREKEGKTKKSSNEMVSSVA